MNGHAPYTLNGIDTEVKDEPIEENGTSEINEHEVPLKMPKETGDYTLNYLGVGITLQRFSDDIL